MNEIEKKFCEGCGFEWEIHFLRKRKDGKYFCVHCVPKNQLKKCRTQSKRFTNLINSLEKKINKLNKDIKAGKIELPNSVSVVCSQKDIERTMRKR